MPSLHDIVIIAFMVFVALALVAFIVQAVWRVLKATWGCFALAALWFVALIIAGTLATDIEGALGLASLAVLVALGAWQYFIGIGGPSMREQERRKREADSTPPVYRHNRTPRTTRLSAGSNRSTTWSVWHLPRVASRSTDWKRCACRSHRACQSGRLGSHQQPTSDPRRVQSPQGCWLTCTRGRSVICLAY